MIDLLGVLGLLRRHVVQRPHHLAGAGQRHLQRIPVRELGQTEVGDLQLAAFVQQQVLRLDVAVDDAVVMGVLQGRADLRHDGQRLARRQPAAVQQLPQVGPVDVLHQEIEPLIPPAEIVHGHDVRMIEQRQGAGLAGEPFGKRRVVGDGGSEDLQGHRAAQLLLPGLVDDPHAAAANQVQDFQLGKLGGQFGRRRRREIRGLPPRVRRGVQADLQPLLEQTRRAQALRRIRRQHSPARSTLVRMGHR